MHYYKAPKNVVTKRFKVLNIVKYNEMSISGLRTVYYLRLTSLDSIPLVFYFKIIEEVENAHDVLIKASDYLELKYGPMEYQSIPATVTKKIFQTPMLNMDGMEDIVQYDFEFIDYILVREYKILKDIEAIQHKTRSD